MTIAIEGTPEPKYNHFYSNQLLHIFLPYHHTPKKSPVLHLTRVQQSVVLLKTIPDFHPITHQMSKTYISLQHQNWTFYYLL